MRAFFRIFILLLPSVFIQAQLLSGEGNFTRADTLRGMLLPERACYNVTFYDLGLRVDPARKWIAGSNRIEFTVVKSTERIQVDLFPELSISRITDEKGKKLKWEREGAAIFIDLKRMYYHAERGAVTIQYEGSPRAAINPPWDGGVSWGKDKEGKDWVLVTCQGLGASVWWPNKDHQTEEPDSMRIAITTPPGLMNVSNGRLRSNRIGKDGWTTWEWFVHNPINNYNVTMNIGQYAHIRDWYVRDGGDSLSLDYYVMPWNVERARAQFRQVSPMLRCFEHHFGPYPFPEDGYKLVESPHPGMEHQSAIAYGNRFENGYLGRATSEEGFWFDFILIHETAHEWFGNSITAADIADMWIHESFGTYMEAVYVECLYGPEAASRYMRGLRSTVLFDRPVVGVYNVNQEGSRDMYPKGALMLHTLRHAIGNDRNWWDVLRRMTLFYRHSIVTYEDITGFMSKMLFKDLDLFFEQYLTYIDIPTLEVRYVKEKRDYALHYRWVTDVGGFELPIKVNVNGTPVIWRASNEWKRMALTGSRRPDVTPDPNWFIRFQYEK